MSWGGTFSVYSEVIKIIFEDKREVDVSCNILDVSRIKEVIDFQPCDLDFGLDEVIKNIKYQDE